MTWQQLKAYIGSLGVYRGLFHEISAELILEWLTEACTIQGRFGRAQEFGESTGNMISEPLKKLDSGQRKSRNVLGKGRGSLEDLISYLV